MMQKTTAYWLQSTLFDVSVLFTSLIFGSFLLKKHMMFTLKLAPLIESSACILFGFIYTLDDKNTFILLGSVFRVVEGIGKSLYFIAFLKLTNSYFDNPRFAITTSETCFCIGWATAPAIGGILYEACGFVGPFAVVGGTLAAIAISAVVLINNNMPMISSSYEKIDKGYTDILKVPMIWILLFDVFMYSFSWTLLSVGFEPHIRVFNLTGTELGLVTIIGSLLFPPSWQFWGRITSTENYVVCLLVTTTLTALGYSLIGPLPFLSVKKTDLY